MAKNNENNSAEKLDEKMSFKANYFDESEGPKVKTKKERENHEGFLDAINGKESKFGARERIQILQDYMEKHKIKGNVKKRFEGSIEKGKLQLTGDLLRGVREQELKHKAGENVNVSKLMGLHESLTSVGGEESLRKSNTINEILGENNLSGKIGHLYGVAAKAKNEEIAEKNKKEKSKRTTSIIEGVAKAFKTPDKIHSGWEYHGT